MRYNNNNLYLVNKYVRLKFAILCGISFGEEGRCQKEMVFVKESKKLCSFY